MTQLNEKLDNIIIKLEELQNTHPNITSVWKNHLLIRQKKFNEELERCEKLLDTLKSKPDLSIEMIHLIITLMKGVNNT